MGDNEKLMANMRARIDQCRKLARLTSDERTRRVLLDMADEAEADLKSLQSHQGS